MAYNEALAENIRKLLGKKEGITEQKMFGGLSFLLHGKMVVGVLHNSLLARIDPQDAETLLRKPHVSPMVFTGKPMRGFIFVGPGGYKTDKQLSSWIDRSLTFVETIKTKKKK